jgi:hypothetical protein
LIRGLIPELVEGGYLIYNMLEDTIIFMEVDIQNITHVKFLLYCFENMFGLKINYHKNKVIVLGAYKEESAQIDDILNCREGKLPITYLLIDSNLSQNPMRLEWEEI